MNEENLLSHGDGKEDETSETKDCSNKHSERRDQAKHRNPSTESHCRPEMHPSQLGKEGEQNRTEKYSFDLWRYLSAWKNGQEKPIREKVDEMIEYIKKDPILISLATKRHDQNSPMFPSCSFKKIPQLSIETKDSGEKYNQSNVQDKDLLRPGPSHFNCDDCFKGECNEDESRYSTFNPSVTIDCSKTGPQEPSIDPCMDPVTNLQLTIHETEKNSLTVLDDALAFSVPSRYTSDEKPHKCDKCGNGFKRKWHLKRHYEGCGSTDKKYACKECHKKYRNKHDLVIHYRTHTGEQPYECVECGKRFSAPSCFSRHKKTCGLSADDRPFACDKCSKRFASKDNLVAHSQIHSDEKPYVCMKCGKNFSTKFYLRKHEKRCGCSLQSKQ